MLSLPVDNEVVVTKLLSAKPSSSGVDRDLDKNFLSGDNRLAGKRKIVMTARCQ